MKQRRKGFYIKSREMSIKEKDPRPDVVGRRALRWDPLGIHNNYLFSLFSVNGGSCPDTLLSLRERGHGSPLALGRVSSHGWRWGVLVLEDESSLRRHEASFLPGSGSEFRAVATEFAFFQIRIRWQRTAWEAL